MSKVQIKGTPFTNTSGERLEDYEAVMAEQAKCHACGCDTCLGYETIICATTGELLIRYYTGALGGPYTQVIEPFDTGLANVKALYRART